MSLFYRRHYEWLARECAELVAKGWLDEAGVVELMNDLKYDNKQFKPEMFWHEYKVCQQAVS